MNNKNKAVFSIFTILFFMLGFVNIYFSYLALGCMILPFILLTGKKKNVWCHGICPRADYLSLFRFFNLGFKAPKWLFSEKMKNNIFMYFCLNLMFITMSTIMVASGNMAPIDKVRLFIAFQLPWDMPQLLVLQYYNPLLEHIAFRLYSLMLSSTILGTLLAVVYKPKTWCVVCPVKTLSTKYLKQIPKPGEV
jgi:hypothetical protein